MKKILYATDFSENAEKAFHYALKITEKHKAELMMLHFFNTPPVWANTKLEDLGQMIREATVKWEEKLQKLFKKFDSSMEPTFLAVDNTSSVKGILSVIKKHKPDLVITGTKGKSLLKELFMGSTTKALIQQSPVPVMAIPKNADYSVFDMVVYASDFQNSDIKALKELIELIKPYQSEIKLIHVSTDNEYKSNQKMERFKELVNDKISYEYISFELLLFNRIF